MTFTFNPGPWGKHCLTVAHCAEKIASACGDMDVEKAYILGLLHDIGRKFGVRHLGHVYDGYVYIIPKRKPVKVMVDEMELIK